MNERDEVAEAARQIAAAIERRSLSSLREQLAPGFVHRVLGGGGADAEAFLQSIVQIPGEIMLVRLAQVEVDMSPTGALVTGVQHAQVLLNDQVVEDQRAFVDWFVRHGGRWCIQAAVDLPHQIPRAVDDDLEG
jgi:hypothetical protein